MVKYLKCFSFSDQNPTPGPGGDTHVEFDEENDELLSFYFGNCIESMWKNETHCLDMLFSGVIQCSQKLAIQYGGCQALVSFWKYGIITYHQSKKVKDLYTHFVLTIKILVQISKSCT